MLAIRAGCSGYSSVSCLYSDVAEVQTAVPGRRWHDSGAGEDAGWNLVLVALMAVGTARDIDASE